MKKIFFLFLALALICEEAFTSENVQIIPPKEIKDADHSQPTEKAHPKHNTHHSEGVSADTSLGWMQNGNIRFFKGHFRKDGKSKLDIQKLIKGQNPHTIVLSCSDSRVPPEHVFDQSLGEIFVIRVAGQALDSSVIASIEYAVEHLGTQLIVVMGHTSCGAVKAALSAKAGESVGSPALDSLVNDIKPRITNSPKSDYVAEASRANAIGVAEDLIKRSKIIAEKLHNNKLRIVSALYRLESGKVEWLSKVTK